MLDAVGALINLVVDLFALFIKGVWTLIKWTHRRMSASTAVDIGTVDVSRSDVECKADLTGTGRSPETHSFHEIAKKDQQPVDAL